jgi:hypothetical protein
VGMAEFSGTCRLIEAIEKAPRKNARRWQGRVLLFRDHWITGFTIYLTPATVVAPVTWTKIGLL